MTQIDPRDSSQRGVSSSTRGTTGYLGGPSRILRSTGLV